VHQHKPSDCDWTLNQLDMGKVPFFAKNAADDEATTNVFWPKKWNIFKICRPFLAEKYKPDIFFLVLTVVHYLHSLSIIAHGFFTDAIAGIARTFCFVGNMLPDQ
jgi:hypothetical protein